MSRVQKIISRSGEQLPPERAANRISAYVYGNILVLAAVVGAGTPSIESGVAILVVAGTTLSTYIAHVFADSIAHSVIHHGEKSPLRDELRDSVPILTSGLVPLAALTLCWLDVLPSTVAQLIAGGIIVFRLAALEVVIERLQNRSLSWRVLGAGLLFALVCASVIIIKLSLHY